MELGPIGSAPGAGDEEARLAALGGYRVVGTAPEPSFDHVADLAANLIGAPVALMSVVKPDRLWLKARHGTTIEEVPRGIAFCDHTIHGDDVLVVPDARQNPRFAASPLAGDHRDQRAAAR